MALRVEWVILADAAQIAGGKLYLLGGGWDVITVRQPFPLAQRCAVAASFTVPWNDTNQQHHVEIEIQDADGHQLARINGQFEVGRPPGIPAGASQRTQLAADLALTFQKPGEFVIITRVEGEEQQRTHFRVAQGK